MTIEHETGLWSSEAGYTIEDETGTVLHEVLPGYFEEVTFEICPNTSPVYIKMTDSYGDGWGDNQLIVSGQTFTLQSGSYGEVCLIVAVNGWSPCPPTPPPPSECNVPIPIEHVTGWFSSEVGYTIEDETGTVLHEVLPGYFEVVTFEICSNTSPVYIKMTDTYGDGWNGNQLIVSGQAFTIESGDYSEVCLSVGVNGWSSCPPPPPPPTDLLDHVQANGKLEVCVPPTSLRIPGLYEQYTTTECVTTTIPGDYNETDGTGSNETTVETCTDTFHQEGLIFTYLTTILNDLFGSSDAQHLSLHPTATKLDALHSGLCDIEMSATRQIFDPVTTSNGQSIELVGAPYMLTSSALSIQESIACENCASASTAEKLKLAMENKLAMNATNFYIAYTGPSHKASLMRLLQDVMVTDVNVISVYANLGPTAVGTMQTISTDSGSMTVTLDAVVAEEFLSVVANKPYSKFGDYMTTHVFTSMTGSNSNPGRFINRVNHAIRNVQYEKGHMLLGKVRALETTLMAMNPYPGQDYSMLHSPSSP